MPDGGSPQTLDRSVLAAMLDMTGGDIAFVDHLVDLYLADASRHLSAIEAALDRDDASALVIPAHSLRSRSLSVGAVTLAHLAHEIELAGRARDLDEARRGATQARAEMTPLEAALRDARSAEWGRR